MDTLDGASKTKIDTVHIRIYQRTSRRYITTIEDLNTDLDLKRITKIMKRKFSCNGCVKTLKDKSSKEIISLTGDQRENVKNFLTTNNIVEEKQIKVHGF